MRSVPGFFSLWRHPAQLLAFGFGAGLAPRAPGTVGSLVALPVYLLLTPLSVPVYLAVVSGLFFLGVWVTGRAERETGVHDHPGIVFDEIVGQLAALTLAPVSVVALLLGFGFFRLFDIWKPFPISWLNHRVPGGWGIMVDDLAAGIAAALCLHGVLALWTPN